MEKYKLKCVRCGSWIKCTEITAICKSCAKAQTKKDKAEAEYERSLDCPYHPPVKERTAPRQSEESEVFDDVMFGSVLGFWDDIF